MFIRSKTLFLRPVWAEDRARIARLGAPPSAFFVTPGRGLPTLAVTLPAQGGAIVGVAGFCAAPPGWLRRFWLAPHLRQPAIMAEAEDALARLASHLPQSHRTILPDEIQPQAA